jgi:hypothetical protein
VLVARRRDRSATAGPRCSPRMAHALATVAATGTRQTGWQSRSQRVIAHVWKFRAETGAAGMSSAQRRRRARNINLQHEHDTAAPQTLRERDVCGYGDRRREQLATRAGRSYRPALARHRIPFHLGTRQVRAVHPLGVQLPLVGLRRESDVKCQAKRLPLLVQTFVAPAQMRTIGLSSLREAKGACAGGKSPGLPRITTRKVRPLSLSSINLLIPTSTWRSRPPSRRAGGCAAPPRRHLRRCPPHRAPLELLPRSTPRGRSPTQPGAFQSSGSIGTYAPEPRTKDPLHHLDA